VDRAVVDRVGVGQGRVAVVRAPGVSGAVTGEAVAVGMGRDAAGAVRSPVLAVRGSGSSRS
jgi:hypothetical protein